MKSSLHNTSYVDITGNDISERSNSEFETPHKSLAEQDMEQITFGSIKNKQYKSSTPLPSKNLSSPKMKKTKTSNNPLIKQAIHNNIGNRSHDSNPFRSTPVFDTRTDSVFSFMPTTNQDPTVDIIRNTFINNNEELNSSANSKSRISGQYKYALNSALSTPTKSDLGSINSLGSNEVASLLSIPKSLSSDFHRISNTSPLDFKALPISFRVHPQIALIINLLDTTRIG